MGMGSFQDVFGAADIGGEGFQRLIYDVKDSDCCGKVQDMINGLGGVVN